MAFLRNTTIRPTLQSVAGWIILVALAIGLVAGLAAAIAAYADSRGQVAAYRADCAGVTSATPGTPGGVCYYAKPSVTFDDPGLGEQDYTLVADVSQPGLLATRATLVGSFDPKHMPLTGNYQVQIWRRHTVRIQIGSRWVLTSANPESRASIGLVTGLVLATLVSWAIVLWMASCLWRGILARRAESAAPPDPSKSRPHGLAI